MALMLPSLQPYIATRPSMQKATNSSGADSQMSLAMPHYNSCMQEQVDEMASRYKECFGEVFRFQILNSTLWVDHISERHNGWYPASSGPGIFWVPKRQARQMCAVPVGLAAALPALQRSTCTLLRDREQDFPDSIMLDIDAAHN